MSNKWYSIHACEPDDLYGEVSAVHELRNFKLDKVDYRLRVYDCSGSGKIEIYRTYRHGINIKQEKEPFIRIESSYPDVLNKIWYNIRHGNFTIQQLNSELSAYLV